MRCNTMNAALTPPSEFQLTGNIPENWTKWKQRLELYISAIGLDKVNEDRKISILLTCLGENGIDIFNSFVWKDDEEDKNKFTDVLKKFDEHFKPKRNVTFMRHKFFTRSQEPGETIDQFVTDLRNKSKDCDFGDLVEGLITDRIVCGIANSHLKERLLREPDLKLSRALEICRAAEISSQQMRVLESGVKGESSVSLLKKRTSQRPQKQTFCQNSKQMSGNVSSSPGKPKYKPKNPCSHCGSFHEFKKCPAFGKTCFSCKKPNHFSKMCHKKVHVVTTDGDQSDNEPSSEDNPSRPSSNNHRYDLFVGNLNKSEADVNDNPKAECKEWRALIRVRDKNVSFKIDTGADINVISKSLLYELGLNENVLLPVKANVTTFSGEKLNVLGKFSTDCQYQNQTGKLYFYVVDFDCDSIVGLSGSEKLNLVKRVESLKTDQINGRVNVKSNNAHVKCKVIPVQFSEFSDLFDGSIGCVAQPVNIALKDNAVPVVTPPRKIPFALMDKLKCKLDEMLEMRIIDKVTEPTEWVHPVVLVQKPSGDLRICLDPKFLNENIRRSHYQLPTIDTVASQLTNAKFFSVLDANAGFWMIPLDKPSSYLCTFSTPFGRFKFNRLPFGVRSAPEIFHRIVKQTFEDLTGVDSYIDDIVVWGSSKEEHDHRLRLVLTRAREKGFKFNPEKCKIGVEEITYLGHSFNKDGVQIDSKKVEAVKNIPSPKCKKDLERFLGLTNYLSKFIDHYADKTAPLRVLLHKDTAWYWDENTDKTFQSLKETLCKAPTLGYFDNSKPITLSVDASSFGLGACILQEGKPLAYASKSLNSCQQNYAQIEKEMLAITFGCEKFHPYLYSRTVYVETDHKPLESIFKKPLWKVPMRLQRMLLKVQPYNLVVKYKPGKLMYVSDTLSRAVVNEPDVFDRELDCHVNLLVHNLPISETQLDRFKNETSKDLVMLKLIECIQSGWPSEKSKVDDAVKPFWNFREELCFYNGLLFKGDKIVVPHSLQADMLKRIHEGHLGIERCKQRAREVMFWPGMSAQITDLIKGCLTCNMYQNSQTKEPMLSYKIPDLPWEHVASDLFMYKNAMYLLVVDYYSNFIEVVKLPDIKSSTVIMYMKSLFARHGIPKLLTSDQGTQYTSSEFAQFMKEWDIKHVFTSPYFPKSNGLAERSVGIIKRLLSKCDESGQDPYLALLNLRNTPRDNLPSPAELLMSRKLNCRLPRSKQMLKPRCVNPNLIKPKINQKRQTSKFYHDKVSKPLNKLDDGKEVMFKKQPKDKKWVHGKVQSSLNQPRSYIVSDDYGNLYNRNRVFISPYNSPKNVSSPRSSPEKSNVLSPNVSSPRSQEKSKVLSPQLNLSNNESVSEEQTVKHFHDHVTRSGRVVRNPKRFTFSSDD